MKTTKYLFAMLMLVFLCLESQAQQTPTNQVPNQNNQQVSPEDKAQRTASHLQKKLGLSQDQSSQVYNLTLNHIHTMQGFKAQKATGQKGMGNNVKQERTNYDNAINALLTPAQQQQWAQLKAEQEAKHNAKKQQNGNNQSNENINYNPNDYSGGTN